MHGPLNNLKPVSSTLQCTNFNILTWQITNVYIYSFKRLLLNQLHVLPSVQSDYNSGNKPPKRESSRSTRFKDMHNQ